MAKDYLLPNGGVYRAITGRAGAVETILRSSAMQRHMAKVAEAAAGRARGLSTDPSGIKASTEHSRDRWRGVVTNTSRQAMAEEYGVRSRGPRGGQTTVLVRKPLGHTLDWVASQDPNRRRGGRAARG